MNGHYDPTRRRALLALVLSLSLFTPACGGCGGEANPDPDAGAGADVDAEIVRGDGGVTLDVWCQQPWTDEVQLSERTRELYGVTRARYDMNIAEDRVRVAFFDDDGAEVGALLMVQPDPALDLPATFRIESPSLDPVDVTISIDVSNESVETYNEVTLSQGGEARAIALFQLDGASTTDAWIAVPADGASPEGSVSLTRADRVLTALPLVELSRVIERDDQEIVNWLDATALSDFIAQPHLRVAGAAFSTEVLRALLDHGQTCAADQLTARSPLGDSPVCTRNQGLDSTCRPHRDGVTTVLAGIGFLASLVPAAGAINLINSSVQRAKGVSDTFILVNLFTRFTVTSQKGVFVLLAAAKDVLRWTSCRKTGTDQACTKGDPHLISFDGLSYDLQAGGEFVMVSSDVSNGPIVHARFAPLRGDAICEDVSVATGLAARFLGDTLSVELLDSGFVRRVNGEVVDRWADAVDLPDGAQLIEGSGLAVMIWPDGSFVSAKLGGSRIDIVYQLAEAWRGKVRGLNGDYDGDWLDDLTTRDGRDLLSSVTFETLYSDYADSWRLTPAESLFTYADGESTDTFTVPNFPLRPALSDLLELEPFQRALETCEEADILPEWIEACVLDVGCTNDPDYAAGLERLGDRAAQLALLDAPPIIEGDAVLLDAPPSVQDDDLVDPRRALVFLEVSRTTLRRDLRVDALVAGTYDSAADLDATARVAADSQVRSYMIHLDPGDAFAGARSAKLTFTTPIVGVALTTESLADSDARAGASGTVYPRGDSRGLELTPDSVALSDDRLSLEITWTADTELDQARVFVVAPPAMEEGQ